MDIKDTIVQLGEMVNSTDEYTRETAKDLLKTLINTVRVIAKIQHLTKLLQDYQLTSPSLLFGWRFCLCQK